MSSSVMAPPAPDGDHRQPQGHCSKCGKVWTLETGQGRVSMVWTAGEPSNPKHTTPPNYSKSSSGRWRKQVPVKSNGYDHLEGEWLTYYNLASRFKDKVRAQDSENILHDIILTLAVAERIWWSR